MKYIFTGGSGMLGSALKEHFPNDLYPTSKELDVTNISTIYNYLLDYSGYTVVHMGAETDTVGIENDSETTLSAINVNIIGTANITMVCKQLNIKVVYISTDYVFDGEKDINESYTNVDLPNPINKYGMSKLAGEYSVKMLDNYLIIRTSFCEGYFKYDQAFEDQWTTRDSARVIGEKIAIAIRNDSKGVLHVGSEQRTVMELAKHLSPHKKITGNSRKSANYPIPKNTALS